jgi:hypothetical protein
MSHTNSIRDQVKIIQQLVNTDLCDTLLREDKMKYLEHMKSVFPNFSEKYMSLFKKIIYKEDITMLEPMLKNIDDLQNGTADEKDITANIGETLAEKYLYPVLGKPESSTEKKPEFITK